jgi:hypothetical protein
MSFFGSLISTIGKVVTTAVTIFKTAKPILEALRPAVDEIDEGFVFIEEQIASGGTVADDFLDRNLDTLIAVEHATGKGVVVLGQINALCAKLRLFSQDQTPDTITPEEAEELGNDILELRTVLAGWKPQLDAAIAKMNAVE